jgi:hypothetical protein
MAYVYTPLQGANSIRLLQLEPGCYNAPLKARLASSRLRDHLYEALSYVWGEPDVSEFLFISDKEFKISKNLHTILLHLRFPERIRRVRTLWIDAICINQEDMIEKGQQVGFMGRIYEQAGNVLCWLGELSIHRLWAMEFLQVLAEESPRYKKKDKVDFVWTFLGDELLPSTDVSLVIEAALEAHVETIYESDWFTRLWVVQEVALAKNVKILCGGYDLSWRDFQIATRILVWCLDKMLRHSSHPKLKALEYIEGAWDIVSVWARYSLNVRPVSAGPITLQLNSPWNIGSLAWDMRKRNCRDDRDRVYALLSLTGHTMNVNIPDPFVPDYTRSVEWAYHQFWRRFGGYYSLFYTGLSRRGARPSTSKDKHALICVDENNMPSWVPELRPHLTRKWKPIFSSDYGTSTPFQHMSGKVKEGPGILMLRGHRFDIVIRGFHATRKIEACQKLHDFVDTRCTINCFLSLKSEYEPYPTGQPWIEALGSALLNDMPYEQSHPFQNYLNSFKVKAHLSDTELRRIWKIYQDLLLSDTGEIWTKVRTVLLSKKKFDPLVELDHDGQLAWMLHNYLGNVLQAHRLIITSRGYMGLAPPETDVGDIVVAFGGPSVPFVVRDTTLEVAGKLVADDTNGHMVGDTVGRALSQLLGPCYLQGIMRNELYEEEMYKEDFEWEKDWMGTLPKPTLCII